MFQAFEECHLHIFLHTKAIHLKIQTNKIIIASYALGDIVVLIQICGDSDLFLSGDVPFSLHGTLLLRPKYHSGMIP